jgi:HD-GYP domain-containing protein (c-di-GMP phosphodiesterase class II)
LAGRIVAFADVYAALTHTRSYRPAAYSTTAALELLTSNSGRLYDRDVVEAFLRVRALVEE